MSRWLILRAALFGRKAQANGCSECADKDAWIEGQVDRIKGLVSEVAGLMDMRATAAKLEELARLEERKQVLLANIEVLRAKEQAERKERRDLPVMPREGRLPPL